VKFLPQHQCNNTPTPEVTVAYSSGRALQLVLLLWQQLNAHTQQNTPLAPAAAAARKQFLFRLHSHSHNCPYLETTTQHGAIYIDDVRTTQSLKRSSDDSTASQPRNKLWLNTTHVYCLIWWGNQFA